jgi:hypothetical protein
MNINIDRNSNLYFDNFWITINKHNELEGVYIDKKSEVNDKKNITIIEKLDTKKINRKLQAKKINRKLQAKKINRKLQAKMIDDEISKYIENDEEVFNDEEDDILMLENYIYNPETKYIDYHVEYDDSEVDDEPYFEINGIVNYSDNQLDLSNYEFYYFGSDSNDLKFYTSIQNDNPFYRISYYEIANEFKLNIIGDCIKTFKFDYDKETNRLTFIKSNINLTQNIQNI